MIGAHQVTIHLQIGVIVITEVAEAAAVVAEVTVEVVVVVVEVVTDAEKKVTSQENVHKAVEAVVEAVGEGNYLIELTFSDFMMRKMLTYN